MILKHHVVGLGVGLILFSIYGSILLKLGQIGEINLGTLLTDIPFYIGMLIALGSVFMSDKVRKKRGKND